MIEIDTSKLVKVLSDALDNTRELLDIHEVSLGRTTVKNKYTAEQYEQQIREIEELIRVTYPKAQTQKLR